MTEFPFDNIKTFIRKPSTYSPTLRKWKIGKPEDFHKDPLKEPKLKPNEREYLLKCVNLADENLYKLKHIHFEDHNKYEKYMLYTMKNFMLNNKDISIRIIDVWGLYGTDLFIIEDYYECDLEPLIKSFTKKTFRVFLDEITDLINKIHDEKLYFIPLIYYTEQDNKIKYRMIVTTTKIKIKDDMIWRLINTYVEIYNPKLSKVLDSY